MRFTSRHRVCGLQSSKRIPMNMMKKITRDTMSSFTKPMCSTVTMILEVVFLELTDRRNGKKTPRPIWEDFQHEGITASNCEAANDKYFSGDCLCRMYLQKNGRCFNIRGLVGN